VSEITPRITVLPVITKHVATAALGRPPSQGIL